MLHVAAFGLAGVTVGSIAFLGWSWFNFREDRKLHPIYKSTPLSSVVLQDYRKTPVETHCADDLARAMVDVAVRKTG